MQSHRPTGSIVKSLSNLVEAGARFPKIYADPPWEYATRASRAAACLHYRTMSLDELCNLPVEQLAADNAHLHLWATSPLLPAALELLAAWGFEYRSCFVWTKDKLGMSNYWRVSHEILLLGVRGKLRFAVEDARSWQTWRRTRHSCKPPVMRELIQRVSPGPYLELFGREDVPNSQWTVFGDQVERRLF